MKQPINQAGIDLLESFESFVGHAYPDPYSPLGKALRAHGLWRQYLKAPIARGDLPDSMLALSGAPWTIGLGFTKGVKEGDTMSREAASLRLARELRSGYVEPILAACTVKPTDNQLAAMACLAWNIGMGWNPDKPKPKGAKDGFRQSSVLRAHNRGDHRAAARAFGLWNKAGGEESDGLTRRRAAEASLYLKPSEDDEVPAMPQVVEPEKPMAASSMNRTAVIAGGTAAVATVSETVKTVNELKEGVDGLGTWLVPILLVVVVVACGYIVFERLKQRKGGWA